MNKKNVKDKGNLDLAGYIVLVLFFQISEKNNGQSLFEVNINKMINLDFSGKWTIFGATLAIK